MLGILNLLCSTNAELFKFIKYVKPFRQNDTCFWLWWGSGWGYIISIFLFFWLFFFILFILKLNYSLFINVWAYISEFFFFPLNSFFFFFAIILYFVNPIHTLFQAESNMINLMQYVFIVYKINTKLCWLTLRRVKFNSYQIMIMIVGYFSLSPLWFQTN